MRGALAQFDGVVEAMAGRDRVRLLLHMLGRNVRVTVLAADVEEIPADSAITSAGA